ncbi:MAG: DinB family protein [Chloroflexi bacterium]|nr:DinB family protein [Chloroflexota bacterium]
MSNVLAAEYSRMVGRLLNEITHSLGDLTLDELHALPMEDGTSIGFNAWHVLRSADNIVQFVFHREPPVWRQQGLAEAWDFPRNEQGTGMDLAFVQAMRFPDVESLERYCRDTTEAVVAKIETMDDDAFAEAVSARIEGQMLELKRGGMLGQVVVSHGNQHLGYIHILRQLLGKGGASQSGLPPELR